MRKYIIVIIIIKKYKVKLIVQWMMDIRRKMGGACMYSVMKANMNGQKLERYWSVGPSNGTTLSSEISYLSDDTPSRYRSTPRDNNIRAAGVGRNRHCRKKKRWKKK